MEPFQTIYDRAAVRKGGKEELEALLPEPAPTAQLIKLADSEVLAEMTRAVFRSGFVWRVIENKWSGFEEVFHNFDVQSCAMMSDEEMESACDNERIVRHAKKIASVRANARYLLSLRDEHGSFGRFVAGWSEQDIVGLWEHMKKNGDRLGGQTGRYFLRFMGKDSPILSRDVVAALIAAGVVDKEPTSKRALAQLQAALNRWMEESGRSLTEISRILALSTGDG